MYKVTEITHRTTTYYVPVDTENEVKYHIKHGNLFRAYQETDLEHDDRRIEKVTDIPKHVTEFYSPEYQRDLQNIMLL